MDYLAEITKSHSPLSSTTVLERPITETRFNFPPCIVAITGVPGTGKSTIGLKLVKHSNLELLDIDQTRQYLFGYHNVKKPAEEKLEMEQSYAENHRLAKEFLKQGKPVLLIATYSRKYYHDQLTQLLEQSGVPFRVFHFIAPDDLEIEKRLQNRKCDPFCMSNIINLNQYHEVQERFKPVDLSSLIEIKTNLPLNQVYQDVINYLQPLAIPPNPNILH